MRYEHAQQFLGGFYAQAPSDIDETRSPGFAAVMANIVMRVFEQANVGVELLRGRYFHGTSDKEWHNDWVELRAFVLPSGAYYISWHVCPESGSYWPLVAIFDEEDEAACFVKTLAGELLADGTGFSDLIRNEFHPNVLNIPWVMRTEGILHLVRRGELRLPTRWERICAWFRREEVPEFFFVRAWLIDTSDHNI